MIRSLPLHNFLFQTDPEGFYDALDTHCTPWIDLCCLLHLVRRYQPKHFLEVGTHRGTTTRLLASRFPWMKIITCDPGDQVPPEQRPPNQRGEYLAQDQVGELVAGYANVTVIKLPFEAAWARDRQVDFIFIDGNHSYPHVLADSKLALELLNPAGGVICWHDVNNVPDVQRALAELPKELEISKIDNTWMAYLDTHPPRRRNA